MIQDLVLEIPRFWIRNLQNDCFFQPLAVRVALLPVGVLTPDVVRLTPSVAGLTHAQRAHQPHSGPLGLLVLGFSVIYLYPRPQTLYPPFALTVSRASLYQLTASASVMLFQPLAVRNNHGVVRDGLTPNNETRVNEIKL